MGYVLLRQYRCARVLVSLCQYQWQYIQHFTVLYTELLLGLGLGCALLQVILGVWHCFMYALISSFSHIAQLFIRKPPYLGCMFWVMVRIGVCIFRHALSVWYVFGWHWLDIRWHTLIRPFYGQFCIVTYSKHAALRYICTVIHPSICCYMPLLVHSFACVQLFGSQMQALGC